MKNVNINITIPGEILLTLREDDKQLPLNMKRYTSSSLEVPPSHPAAY